MYNSLIYACIVDSTIRYYTIRIFLNGRMRLINGFNMIFGWKCRTWWTWGKSPKKPGEHTAGPAVTDQMRKGCKIWGSEKWCEERGEARGGIGFNRDANAYKNLKWNISSWTLLGHSPPPLSPEWSPPNCSYAPTDRFVVYFQKLLCLFASLSEDFTAKILNTDFSLFVGWLWRLHFWWLDSLFENP